MVFIPSLQSSFALSISHEKLEPWHVCCHAARFSGREAQQLTMPFSTVKKPRVVLWVIFMVLSMGSLANGMPLYCGCGGGGGAAKTVKRPPQRPVQPPYANYWAPLTRKRHIRHIQHSPGTPTTGHRRRRNDTSRSTGRSGRQNAATRRNVRREGRVTVQGPVKKQQPDGMSHRGANTWWLSEEMASMVALVSGGEMVHAPCSPLCIACTTASRL